MIDDSRRTLSELDSVLLDSSIKLEPNKGSRDSAGYLSLSQLQGISFARNNRQRLRFGNCRQTVRVPFKKQINYPDTLFCHSFKHIIWKYIWRHMYSVNRRFSPRYMLLIVRECSCSLTDNDEGVAVSALLYFLTELAVVLSQRGHIYATLGHG